MFIIQHLLRAGAETEAWHTCLPVALHLAIVNSHKDAVSPKAREANSILLHCLTITIGGKIPNPFQLQ